MKSIEHIDTYQQDSRVTAQFGGWHPKQILAYVSLGVADEAGEVAGKVKKIFRGDKQIDDAFKAELIKEMGDVYWYLARMADYFELRTSEILGANMTKLLDRQARGVIQGDGDNR